MLALVAFTHKSEAWFERRYGVPFSRWAAASLLLQRDDGHIVPFQRLGLSSVRAGQHDLGIVSGAPYIVHTLTEWAEPRHVRVIELSHVLAGPICGLMLADMGAEVIKVERPDGGDAQRWDVSEADKLGSDSASFFMVNRGKDSVAIDPAP